VPIHLKRGQPIFLIWYASLDRETAVKKDGTIHIGIDPELITGIASELQSFAGLSKKVKDVDKVLGDRIHALEKEQTYYRVIGALALALMIALTVNWVKDGLPSWLSAPQAVIAPNRRRFLDPPCDRSHPAELRRIGALYDIEKTIRGSPPEWRLAVRQNRCARKAERASRRRLFIASLRVHPGSNRFLTEAHRRKANALRLRHSPLFGQPSAAVEPADGSLDDPTLDSGDSDEAHEGGEEFVVSGCDTSELLELVEEIGIALPLFLAVALRRDDGLDTPAVDEVVGIIAFVGDRGTGPEAVNKIMGKHDVVAVGQGAIRRTGLPSASAAAWTLVLRPRHSVATTAGAQLIEYIGLPVLAYSRHISGSARRLRYSFTVSQLGDIYPMRHRLPCC